MDMPLFESGLKAEGGSTFSVAIASPFESSSTLPSRSEPLPPSVRDLVDACGVPKRAQEITAGPEVSTLYLRLLFFVREKAVSPNALALGVAERLAQGTCHHCAPCA